MGITSNEESVVRAGRIDKEKRTYSFGIFDTMSYKNYPQ